MGLAIWTLSVLRVRFVHVRPDVFRLELMCRQFRLAIDFGENPPRWRLTLLAAVTGLFTGVCLLASISKDSLIGMMQRSEEKLKLTRCASYS